MFEVNVTSLKDRKTVNRQMVIKQFVSNNTNQNKIKLPTYSFFSYMNVMFPSCCWGWALMIKGVTLLSNIESLNQTITRTEHVETKVLLPGS